MGVFLTMVNIQFFLSVQKCVNSEYIVSAYSVIFKIAGVFMLVGSIVFCFILNPTNVLVMLIGGIGIIFSVVLYKLLMIGK